MTKLRIVYIPIIALLFPWSITFAQHTKCGTIVTPQEVARMMSIPGNGQVVPQFQPVYCVGKTLSITAHIISDSLGNYGLAEATVNSSVSVLNGWFAPICISFQVCQFDYIPNYKYDYFQKPLDEQELINLYSVPNTINIFYVQTVEVAPGSTVGGYAYLPGGPDFIVIDKSSPGVITHEMGHFFGMLHTFETQYGIELVNESNCLTAGDFICDTPADPGLGNTASPDCQLSPYVVDVNGEWYVPHIGNIMSYYSDDCVCGFTTDQYNKMAANYLCCRFYLW